MNTEKLRTLGPKEASLILGLIENGEMVISRQEAATRMETSIGSADQILRRLVSKGWLAKAGKGSYLVEPPELGAYPLPEGEAYALLEVSEPEAVVAYGSAAALWSLTTQLRHTIIAVAPKRPWSRQIGPATLRRLRGETPKEDIAEKNVRGHKVRLFSIEKTAIDCLRRPELCGGEDEARQILLAASRKWDWGALRSLLERIGQTATNQRVGHTLDALGAKMPQDFRTWLTGTIPARSRAYLTPGGKGRYDRVWRVIA